MNRRQQFRKITCSAIIIILPLLLLMNIPGFFKDNDSDLENKTSTAQTDTTQNSSKKFVENAKKYEKEYLIKSYQNAVTEIQKRIEHEHLLFVLKFTLVGAVLGVLFKVLTFQRPTPNDTTSDAEVSDSSPSSAYLFFCCAIAVSAILDVRMLFNLNIIIELGGWVHSLETHILTSGITGWETYYKESKLLNTWASPILLMDRQLLTWVLYIATVYQFIIHTENSAKSHIAPFLICLVLFSFVGQYFYYSTDYGNLYFVFCISVITLCYYAYSKLMELNEELRDE